MIRSKICGVSDQETLKYIINHKYHPQFVGFICNYSKSKRYVEFDKLAKLIDVDRKSISFVAVLVDPNDLCIKGTLLENGDICSDPHLRGNSKLTFSPTFIVLNLDLRSVSLDK